MAFQPVEIIQLHGLSIGLDRAQVSPMILKSLLKGWYEGAEVRILKKLLEPGDRLLEMGTAIGITAMTAARIVGEQNVCTFELNPVLVEWARDNFALNGLNIEVSQRALMAESQHCVATVDFHIHPNFWGSSLVKRPDTIETIDVETGSFEKTIEKRNINCLLIDIEGGELDLLLNARISGIDKIILETHYHIVGKEPSNALVQHLVDQGFFLDLSMTEGGVVALYRL